MISWTLLRLNPQSQERYCDHVQEHYPDVEIYFPQYQKTTRPAGKRHPIQVTLPVYPGYIFVHIGMENESIYLLTHAPTKAWFVRFGGLISVIPEGVITELRRLELARELMREEVVSHPFNPGRKVIVHFPTADIHAVVLRLLNESRVVVDSPLGNITVPVHKLSLR